MTTESFTIKYQFTKAPLWLLKLLPSWWHVLLLCLWPLAPSPSHAQSGVVKVTDNVFMAAGSGNISSNTFMVITSEGVVIIDTSSAANAPAHYAMLRPLSNAPVKCIILTHGHGDHTGGVSLWKQSGTTVIAQSNMVEFLNYETRLKGFLGARSAAQGGLPPPVITNPNPGNYAAVIPADTLFDKTYSFKLGSYTFKLFSTPGETPDHLSVWIPEIKAAFVGDNYYASFPNLYTLRGTKPRYALDYVQSLNTVISWGPEYLLPSHGAAVKTKATVTKTLNQYASAILYVHDAVVAGMNSGVDVFTLMSTIKLPPNLYVGEGYGKVGWSVRGIYDGYAGWFDMDAVNMYATPATAALPELVALTSGVSQVTQRARNVLNGGNTQLAMHLANAAIAADKHDKDAWMVRRDALTRLIGNSNNGIERNWLQYNLDQADAEIALP